MEKNHIHYEVAKQWLEGARVQRREGDGQLWRSSVYPDFRPYTQYRITPPPHPHRDIIKAWADGEVIERWLNGTWAVMHNPHFRPTSRYRVAR